MLRRRRQLVESLVSPRKDLVKRLIDELSDSSNSAQPQILEKEFPNGNLRVIVVWDAWNGLLMEHRTAIIHEAYSRIFHAEIALANGLTVPEAHAAGFLPFHIVAGVRDTDDVTVEQCRQLMINQGASILRGAESPELRFESREDADECVHRLKQACPESSPVWIVLEDVGPIEDWMNPDLA